MIASVFIGVIANRYVAQSRYDFRYLAVSKQTAVWKRPLDLKQLITEGIKDLPQSYLSEVADFVLFIRRKAHEQQPFDIEAIQDELRLMNAHEVQHLEDEFADFAQRFPKE